MTPTRLILLALATAVAAAGPALAQRVQLPDGSGRQLQLFDLEPLLRAAGGPELRLDVAPERRAVAPAPAAGEAVLGGGGIAGAPPAGAPARDRQREREADAEALGRLLAQFVEPPLGAGDDCRVLAGRWLALLASPEQLASAEQLVRTANEQRERLVDVEVRMLQLAHDAFTAKLQPRLTKVQRGGRDGWEAIVPADGADAFAELVVGAASGWLDAPKLTVAPLHRATAALKEQVAYVRDLVVTPVQDTFIADPVIDVVWDGWEAETFVAPRRDGMLGIAVSVTHQQLEKPIAQFKTTLPGTKIPAMLQLPRVTGTRLQQTAVVAPGALVAIAARKADGTWLVALVRAAPHPK
jgi:hypothetical protein